MLPPRGRLGNVQGLVSIGMGATLAMFLDATETGQVGTRGVALLYHKELPTFRLIAKRPSGHSRL